MTTKMEWKARQRRLEMVGEEADELVGRLNLSPRIDPLDIAYSERRQLRVGGADLGSRYDGKLEFNKAANKFLLFFNTKYDRGLPPGMHHPRTRFSISHELGHYFLTHHHEYLRLKQRSHRSVTEFRRKYEFEREADAFAASLLLPTKFVRPIVNRTQLSMNRIEAIADEFITSLICTTFRAVRLSDFPCAVAGIQNGTVSWLFPSKAMIANGIYPKREHGVPSSLEPWSAFADGINDRSDSEGEVRDWFQTYERDDLERMTVREEFVPVRAMNTLLVLLTLDEREMDDEDEHEEDE